MTVVSVVGLGKLGSPMMAVLAEAGIDTIGYDTNPMVVEAINAGRAPVDEPGLQEYIARNRARMRATTDLAEAIGDSEVTFIIVPTPSGPDDTFTNEFVEDALRAIGSVLRSKDGYHNVVVSSTVMPGSMDGPLRHAIEESSGRSVGDHLGFCYNPEFIALGSVIRDMESPDVILIGESDPAAGDQLSAIHTKYVRNAPSVRRMNWVNAEITKIAINTFVTTKISFANMLSGLCDTLDGADADTVTQAVGSDTRVGTKYLRAGVAYGGPCFPRDNRALAALGRARGVPMGLADATDAMNDWQTERLLRVVGEVSAPGSTVAVLGMSYKPGTSIWEASQGVALVRRLRDSGYTVRATDPAVFEAPTAPSFSPDVEVSTDHRRAIRGAAVVVVATPWDVYRGIDVGEAVLIDPWGVVETPRSTDVRRPGRDAGRHRRSAAPRNPT